MATKKTDGKINDDWKFRTLIAKRLDKIANCLEDKKKAKKVHWDGLDLLLLLILQGKYPSKDCMA